jgi:ABC-type branched-subunit amino acid transport system substrate-binding protein
MNNGGEHVTRRKFHLRTQQTMTPNMRKFSSVSVLLILVILMVSLRTFNCQETIKIGILHSLSGTMAISETPLKDTILLMIEQQNAKGGLLGRKVCLLQYTHTLIVLYS